jgi:hypothetical protein
MATRVVCLRFRRANAPGGLRGGGIGTVEADCKCASADTHDDEIAPRDPGTLRIVRISHLFLRCGQENDLAGLAPH